MMIVYEIKNIIIKLLVEVINLFMFLILLIFDNYIDDTYVILYR